MDEKEQQAWDECLKLWKELSETPWMMLDKYESMHTFKQAVLDTSGIEKSTFGCPFCRLYFDNGRRCQGCPIALYNKTSYACEKRTPYYEWFEAARSGAHHQGKAKKFYNYLLKRYEERKLEDN